MITRLHQVNFKKLTTRIRAYKNRYCLTHHNKRSRYVRYVSAWWILINSALPAAPASSVASRQLHDAQVWEWLQRDGGRGLPLRLQSGRNSLNMA